MPGRWRPAIACFCDAKWTGVISLTALNMNYGHRAHDERPADSLIMPNLVSRRIQHVLTSRRTGAAANTGLALVWRGMSLPSSAELDGPPAFRVSLGDSVSWNNNLICGVPTS